MTPHIDMIKRWARLSSLKITSGRNSGCNKSNYCCSHLVGFLQGFPASSSVVSFPALLILKIHLCKYYWSVTCYYQWIASKAQNLRSGESAIYFYYPLKIGTSVRSNGQGYCEQYSFRLKHQLRTITKTYGNNTIYA